MSAALSDIRVLDLSFGVAGPYCAKLLAGFGAEVVKVESPAGDPGRRLAPMHEVKGQGTQNASGFFAFLNAGKQGIALDLESPRGRSLVRSLALDADVIVESFTPGYLDERGLGYDSLATLSPSLIMASVTPFGQTGPWRLRPGDDLTVYALSGWGAQNGFAGRPPLKGPGYQASFLSSIVALIGTVAALLHRDATGEGQHVDVSMLEALTEAYGPRLLAGQYNGEERDDYRGRDRTDFSAGPVPCRDGYFSLTLSRAHFWRNAMVELGLPELATDEQFLDRRRHADDLAALVDPAIARRDKYELFEALSTVRVVSGMVLSTEELLADPHSRARSFFREVEQPPFGSIEMPGPPFKMSLTPAAPPAPSPALGEHTETVLATRLGLSATEIAGLKGSGVVL